MRIIKRKKGNRDYYYLQHSFRKDGKVITREKYIGVAIPKNMDKVKSDFKKEIQPDLYTRLEKIQKDFRKDWGNLPESIKQQQKKEIAITFTFNTNAIEGSTISESEVRGIILDNVSPNKSLKDIKETESHNAVFLDMLEKDVTISNMLLLNWHTKIFNRTKPEIAGHYRNFNVRVGPHIAPRHQKVKSLMNQLNQFIQQYKEELNPVELSAIVHYRFEKIHPFGDGNGRIGRLLMNHILWFSGYPVMIMEYNKRTGYYNALNKTEDGFISYYLKQYLNVHEKKDRD